MYDMQRQGVIQELLGYVVNHGVSKDASKVLGQDAKYQEPFCVALLLWWLSSWWHVDLGNDWSL